MCWKVIVVSADDNTGNVNTHVMWENAVLSASKQVMVHDAALFGNFFIEVSEYIAAPIFRVVRENNTLMGELFTLVQGKERVKQ
jgi:hypothetical protein